MTITVLVVLVNFRRTEDTLSCIQSLKQLVAPTVDLMIAVCDNESSATSATALIETLQMVPCDSKSSIADAQILTGTAGLHRCLLLLSLENTGFAGGNNLAYRAADPTGTSDYVWFLNNDTEVAPDSLLRLIERMELEPRIGLCGATLVYSWDRRLVQCMGGCRINRWTGATRQLGHLSSWPCTIDEANIELQMDYPAGASILASRRFLDIVGLMAEDYFLFYEEIDWSIRARRAGFHIGYAARAVVYHKEGASIGSGTGASRSALAEYFGLRNKLRFTWRFYPWAWPSVWLISWLQVVRRLTQRKWQRAGLMARTLLGVASVPHH